MWLPHSSVSQVHALQNDIRKEAHCCSAENPTEFIWQFKIQKPLSLLPNVNVIFQLPNVYYINIYSTINVLYALLLRKHKTCKSRKRNFLRPCFCLRSTRQYPSSLIFFIQGISSQKNISTYSANGLPW